MGTNTFSVHSPSTRFQARLRARTRNTLATWDGTTPQRLRLARGAMILATVLTGLTGAVLTSGAVHSVQRIDSQTSRALVATRQAHADLVDADRSAIHSFVSGDMLLAGPGQGYQDAIKTANQEIEQVAEAVGDDPAAGQQLQAIDAELVTYTGLVEQADAAHRAEVAGGTDRDRQAGLGSAYLWYASRTLHEPDSGLLARIDQLGDGRQQTLDARPWWLGHGARAAYLVTALALLGCLGLVQVWTLRRFRRIVNPPLAVAIALALVVCAWTAADLVHVQQTYRAAEQSTLEPLLHLWQVRASAADADGQSALATLQAPKCPSGTACSSTLTGLATSVRTAARTARASEQQLPAEWRSPQTAALATSLAAAQNVMDDARRGNAAAATTAVQAGEPGFAELDADLAGSAQLVQRLLANQLASAQDVPGLRFGAPVLALLILILALLGIDPRLHEYRTGV